jgi:F0F1-type ATP synthase delta subunit
MKSNEIKSLLSLFPAMTSQNKIIKILDSSTDLKKSVDTILKSFPSLTKEVAIELASKSESIRAALLSREKIIIQVPISISEGLVTEIYQNFESIFKKPFVLILEVDSDIVVGLRVVYKGKIQDFTFNSF